MNKTLCAVLLATFAAPALAADVGVSITLGQPGFYGQIDIGNIPRPPLLYAQPVVIVRSPQYVSAEPIYLHVPPATRSTGASTARNTTPAADRSTSSEMTGTTTSTSRVTGTTATNTTAMTTVTTGTDTVITKTMTAVKGAVTSTGDQACVLSGCR